MIFFLSLNESKFRNKWIIPIFNEYITEKLFLMHIIMNTLKITSNKHSIIANVIKYFEDLIWQKNKCTSINISTEKEGIATIIRFMLYIDVNIISTLK